MRPVGSPCGICRSYGHFTKDHPEGYVNPMYDALKPSVLPLQSKVGAKLDDTICRMLAVIDRYTEDSRGPSATWARELAGTVEVLMRCKRLA